jgi:hypothetical protein
MRVLVAYASRHCATQGIAERIAETLRAGGLDAEARPAASVKRPADYDAFVIGSAAYMFHWLGYAAKLVRRNRAALAAKPVWLFSSGPLGGPHRRPGQGPEAGDDTQGDRRAGRGRQRPRPPRLLRRLFARPQEDRTCRTAHVAHAGGHGCHSRRRLPRLVRNRGLGLRHRPRPARDSTCLVDVGLRTWFCWTLVASEQGGQSLGCILLGPRDPVEQLARPEGAGLGVIQLG